jgi:hypothetical protein
MTGAWECSACRFLNNGPVDHVSELRLCQACVQFYESREAPDASSSWAPWSWPAWSSTPCDSGWPRSSRRPPK